MGLDCLKWRPYKVRSLVSNSIYTKKDRNNPPSANQVVFIAKPRHAHAVCTLWVHPPTSPYPALSAEAEPISKDIAGSNAESLMTDIPATSSQRLLIYLINLSTWFLLVLSVTLTCPLFPFCSTQTALPLPAYLYP